MNPADPTMTDQRRSRIEHELLGDREIAAESCRGDHMRPSPLVPPLRSTISGLMSP